MPDGALNVSNRFAYKNTEVITLMNNVKHIADEKERQRVLIGCRTLLAMNSLLFRFLTI